MWITESSSSFTPTPEKIRKDEIRARTYEYVVQWGWGFITEQKPIDDLIVLMANIYDTVESLPDKEKNP